MMGSIERKKERKREMKLKSKDLIDSERCDSVGNSYII